MGSERRADGFDRGGECVGLPRAALLALLGTGRRVLQSGPVVLGAVREALGCVGAVLQAGPQGLGAGLAPLQAVPTTPLGDFRQSGAFPEGA